MQGKLTNAIEDNWDCFAALSLSCLFSFSSSFSSSLFSSHSSFSSSFFLCLLPLFSPPLASPLLSVLPPVPHLHPFSLSLLLQDTWNCTQHWATSQTLKFAKEGTVSHKIAQTAFKFSNPPVSPSRYPGLQACTTWTGLKYFLLELETALEISGA